MADQDAGTSTATASTGDEQFVRGIGRWALVTTVLIIAFDIAVLRNYPFPDLLASLRAPFYTVLAIVLLLASLFLAFLGYRVVSLRYVRRIRSIYLIFLPLVVLIASFLSFALLSGAG